MKIEESIKLNAMIDWFRKRFNMDWWSAMNFCVQHNEYAKKIYRATWLKKVEEKKE